MIGKHSNAYASCRIAYPTTLPDEMQGPILELRSLKTRKDKRRKGFASALMTEVCIEADLHRRFLLLCVEPEDDTPLEALANFYVKHGFQPIQAEPLLMLRPFAGAYG